MPKPTTRHYGASRSAGADDATRIARLVLKHQVPERGVSPSADRMLDTVEQVIKGQGGIGYEVNKIADWIQRFPLRAVAARVEPGWENRADRTEVAEAVLMRGWSSHRTAIEYGTTAETVDVIVAAYRMDIKRGRTR